VELSRALENRGFATRAVQSSVARLETEGWLDEAGAARSTVRVRGGRYGRARVARELRARGFSAETIAAAFEAEGGARLEEEALRRAFEKLWAARSHLAPAVRRRRVFDALTRRGFPADGISEIIRNWYEVD
jgi:SOS response regulatory protein OraA/RecX